MNTSGKRQVKAEAQNANRHAVVLGGSLAGLLTARILSDHFEHVTLIERDAYLDTTETRRGIPQANHVQPVRPGDREKVLRESRAPAPAAHATQSVAVRKVLLRAFNMLTRPTALFHPRVLFRVLVQVLKPARRNVARPRLTLKPATEREAS